MYKGKLPEPGEMVVHITVDMEKYFYIRNEVGFENLEQLFDEFVQYAMLSTGDEIDE